MQDAKTDALIAHLKRVIHEYENDKATIRFTLDLDYGTPHLVTYPDGSEHWEGTGLVNGNLKMMYTLPRTMSTLGWENKKAKIGDEMYVPNKGWSGTIIDITDLSGPTGGRVLTIRGPGKEVALIHKEALRTGSKC